MPIPADPLDAEQQENLVANVSKLNTDVYNITKANTTNQDYYKQNDYNEAIGNKSQKELPRWNRKYALYLIILILTAAVVVVLTLLVTNKPSATGSFTPTVYGGLTSWGHWSTCTLSCGEGVKIRSRSCSNSTCSGDSFEISACAVKKCQEAGWSGWSDWGSCSVTCGLGMRRRQRLCNDPQPSPLGSYCKGSSEEADMCNQPSCYEAGWSGWSDWGSCSVTCGLGLKRRQRLCNNPQPSLFGSYCNGSSEEADMCNQPSCYEAGWSDWSDWGSCSVTCGLGLKKRQRLCNNPQPSPFGSYCNGSSEEVDMCNQPSCYEAVWSGWADWGSCSVTCGLGMKRRQRLCNNPQPPPMGSYCNGSSEEVDMCNQPSCYAVGWSPWGQWSTCTESCGGGIQFRSRSCLFPTSSNGHQACTGEPTEITKCNSVSCPNEISDVKYPLYFQTGVLGFDYQHLDSKINNAVKSSTGRVVYYSIPLLPLTFIFHLLAFIK